MLRDSELHSYASFFELRKEGNDFEISPYYFWPVCKLAEAETSGIKQIEGPVLEGLTGNKDLAYNFRLQLDKQACF